MCSITLRNNRDLSLNLTVIIRLSRTGKKVLPILRCNIIRVATAYLQYTFILLYILTCKYLSLFSHIYHSITEEYITYEKVSKKIGKKSSYLPPTANRFRSPVYQWCIHSTTNRWQQTTLSKRFGPSGGQKSSSCDANLPELICFITFRAGERRVYGRACQYVSSVNSCWVIKIFHRFLKYWIAGFSPASCY